MNDTKIIMHRFKINNKYYVYDTVTNSVFHITKDVYNELCVLEKIGAKEFVCQHKDSKALSLVNKGFFCAPKSLDICHPHYELIESLIDNRLSNIVLQVTKDCNFQCRYCGFAGTGTYMRQHTAINMSFDIAKKAVDYLYDHSENTDKVCMCFYGGEPLLNFELIKNIVDYSREKFFAKELEFHMTTNASLLREDVVVYLEENKINLLISLDGPKEIQNRHRLFLYNGKGTFDVVVRNVQNLINNHKKYFSNHVKFNPVMLNQEEKNEIKLFFANDLKIPEDKLSIRNADLKGVDYVNDYITDNLDDHPSVINDDVYEMNRLMLTERNTINSPWQHNGPCIPGVDRLFVSCDGKYYPCEKVPEINCVEIGDVESGINILKVKELTNLGKLTEKECINCWAKHFCMVCLARCVDYKGGTVSREIKLQECKQTQINADLFLKKYVEGEHGYK